MSSYMAELWAIRDGLLLAPDLGSPTLCLELYVLAVVHLMKCTVANQLMEHLLTDCMNLLKVLYWTRIEYIYIAN